MAKSPCAFRPATVARDFRVTIPTTRPASSKSGPPELPGQGYHCVPLSELLAAGRPVAVEACYEERPGDNRRYDALFGRGTGK